MSHFLAPHFRAVRVTDITPEFLKAQGIRAAILDLDGNLVGYRQDTASPEVVAWIANMLAEGIKLCIVSNPGPKSTLQEIAEQVGLTSFRGKIPKPLPKAFLNARKYLGEDLRHIAMIGDQLFTDMIGGNLVGMLTIWVDTIPGHQEGWITRKINRRLEGYYRTKILATDPKRSPYISTL